MADTSEQVPQQDTDESYNLTFVQNGTNTAYAVIQANSVFGARHGLETFSQLTSCDRMSGVYSVSGMNISDVPRFPFRGACRCKQANPVYAPPPYP